jgi:hypothetical protein
VGNAHLNPSCTGPREFQEGPWVCMKQAVLTDASFPVLQKACTALCSALQCRTVPCRLQRQLCVPSALLGHSCDRGLCPSSGWTPQPCMEFQGFLREAPTPSLKPPQALKYLVVSIGKHSVLWKRGPGKGPGVLAHGSDTERLCVGCYLGVSGLNVTLTFSSQRDMHGKGTLTV